MTNCKHITKNGRCGLKGSYAYRHGCFGEDMCRCREPMTNAQRIRAMSDEELCDLLDEWWCMGANNEERLAYADERLAWLQQPEEEDNNA